MEVASQSINNKSKEYTLASDDKTFGIKLSLSSNILIEVNELENVMGNFYEKSFSLDSLVDLSRGFKLCENIGEAYDILEEIFDGKKVSIKDINENSIILVINISLPGRKMQQTELVLNKNEVNKNIVIENLVKKVNQLEKENTNLKNEINELKKNLNEFKTLFENEIKKINKFETLFENEIKSKESIQKIQKTGMDSKIFENFEELKFIIDRLMIKFPKEKTINFRLLYRATRDGDNANCFHNKVNNKNSTLSIIKTSNGTKFGVFLEIPFQNKDQHIVDDECFIFSVDLRKIYNSKKGTYSLNDYESYFLNLYNQPIYILDNCLSNINSYTCSKSRANEVFLGFEKDYELNKNEQYFNVKEMETFQIYTS